MKGDLLLRVDDRGIHGQIIVGWLGRLNISSLILCREEGQEIPEAIYAASIPEGVKFSILKIDEIIKEYQEGVRSKLTLVVSYSLKTAYELIERGLKVKEVNIGGLHSGEGKKRILNFVYLGEEDILYLKKIHAKGVTLFAQELPDSKRYNVAELIGIK